MAVNGACFLSVCVLSIIIVDDGGLPSKRERRRSKHNQTPPLRPPLPAPAPMTPCLLFPPAPPRPSPPHLLTPHRSHACPTIFWGSCPRPIDSLAHPLRGEKVSPSL